jgi:hypothetical protein
MRHEKERYSDECAIAGDFDAFGMGFSTPAPAVKDPNLLRLRTTLGTSICAYTVAVTGVSLTSEAVRDVVFTETKSYDRAKLAALSAYVGSLFARLAALPVQAVPDASWCKDENPRCSNYHFAVIDPTDGGEFVLEGLRLRGLESGIQSISQSSQELWACNCGLGAVFRETAIRAAQGTKLTVDDVWANLPFGLSRHRHASDASADNQETVVARFQLFDDGWRVLDVSRRN